MEYSNQLNSSPVLQEVQLEENTHNANSNEDKSVEEEQFEVISNVSDLGVSMEEISGLLLEDSTPTSSPGKDSKGLTKVTEEIKVEGSNGFTVEETEKIKVEGSEGTTKKDKEENNVEGSEETTAKETAKINVEGSEETTAKETAEINVEGSEETTAKQTESQANPIIEDCAETNIKTEEENETTYDDDLDADGWLQVLGNDQLKKRIVRHGEKDSRPVRGDTCIVTFEGKLDNGTTIECETRMKVPMGDNMLVPGLDLTIPLMNKGEISEVIMEPRFAYGEKGLLPHVPRNSRLHFSIELVDIQSEGDIEDMTVTERREIGNCKRERGNFWYSREEYSISIQCYRRSLEYLDDVNGYKTTAKEGDIDKDAENDELQELLEDRLKVYNNLAAAQLKLDALEAALKSVETVLRCQPSNVKALFRKGKILSAQGHTDPAVSLLRQALTLEPDNKAIHHELSNLTIRQKKEHSNEKDLYRRMFKDSLDQTSSEIAAPSSRKSKMVWSMVAGTFVAVVAGVIAMRYRF